MTSPLNSFGALPVSDVVARADGPCQLHGLERTVSVLEPLGESDVPLRLGEICRPMKPHNSA